MRFDPTLMGTAVRSVAVFMVYTTMALYGWPPFFTAFVALLGGFIARLKVKRLRSHDWSAMPLRTRSYLFFYSAWLAFNVVLMLYTIQQLHPLRFVVGEFAEYGVAVLATIGDGSKRLTAICFVIGLVTLCWATHFSSYAANATSEDESSAVDALIGALLLVSFCLSDACRKRFRDTVTSVAHDDADVDGLAMLMSAAMVCFPGLLFAFSSTSGACFSVSALLFCPVACGLLVGAPVLFASQQHTRVGYIAPHIRILVSAVVAAVLHVGYHFHVVDGEPEENQHPVMHLDNLLIVVATLLMAGGLRGINSERSQRTASYKESLDPVTLFAPSMATTDSSSLIETIMSDAKQRKLSVFLMLTLLYMLVELIYGLHANSLGLVSDSFHMLLDSASIAIGLFASYMGTWRPNSTHNFGYGRYEVLSGFTNGVLLVFVAGYVFIESISRLFEPPEIRSDYLVFVSFCGLMVNVVGIVFFHEAHSHGHGSCGGCSHDLNMEGVYLHILGDFFGSVSVIISSIVVRWTGFMMADPICSAFVSLLILVSSWGLLRASATVLLQEFPDGFDRATITSQLSALEGVKQVGELHVWTQGTSPSVSFVSTVHLRVAESCDEQLCRKQAFSVLRSHSLHHCCAIQIEK